MGDIDVTAENTPLSNVEDSDDAMTERTVEVSPDTLQILGLPTAANTHGPASSRTIHLRDRDLLRHSGVAVCRLTSPVLTVTRMTNAAGLPYLLFTFRYQVTSLGFSAPGLITQSMEFWNAEGGTIFQWGFDAMQQGLLCDDDHREESWIWSWSRDVDWFDLWRRCRWRHHHWTVEQC
jgi:hypothetical protein